MANSLGSKVDKELLILLFVIAVFFAVVFSQSHGEATAPEMTSPMSSADTIPYALARGPWARDCTPCETAARQAAAMMEDSTWPKVNVLGAVQRPGIYPARVLGQAIAWSGGPMYSADVQKVRVLHVDKRNRTQEKVVSIAWPMQEAISGIELAEGDTILVPLRMGAISTLPQVDTAGTWGITPPAIPVGAQR